MIYFIQSGAEGGPIKIGYTAFDDAVYRMKRLQIGNPVELHLLGVIDGSVADERDLQHRFAHAYIRGEWFEACEELVAYIAARAMPHEAVKHSNAPRIKLLPSVEEARAVLLYDETEGVLKWRERPPGSFKTEGARKRWNEMNAGKAIAGRSVKVGGRPFPVSTVIQIVNNVS